MEKVKQALLSSHIVALQTDTVLGLVADPKRPSALRKLNDIKERPKSKHYVLITNDIAVFEGEIVVSPLSNVLMERHWPGPLTIIFQTLSGTTLGVRIPNEPFLLQLLQSYGRPLVMTSANRSSEPECKSRKDIQRTFGRSVVNCVPSVLPKVDNKKPSTVVAMGENGTSYSILRQGELELEVGVGGRSLNQPRNPN